ncbi:unnamed protein product [Chrysodeixis includens]|uniref:Protein kinase domain-containing protein n=1 Tax=Chrysodeixis includens TaxID=689277 RepID=A0A9P0FWC9_CHRIL|nr:unnamed protein product [Chrysodeixis includens]
MWSSTLFCVLGVLGATCVTGVTPPLAAREGVTPSCKELERKYDTGEPRRALSCDGEKVKVLLVWGSEPARAAATLLLVLLRHVRRYDGLKLEKVPLGIAELAVSKSSNNESFKERPEVWREVVVSVSTAFTPSLEPWSVPRRRWSPDSGDLEGLAGGRLTALDDAGVPARRALHARLVPGPLPAACRRCARWTFYTNTTALQLCGFLNSSSSGSPSKPTPSQLPCELDGSGCPELVAYGVNESAALLPELVRRAAAAGVRLRAQTLDRVTLIRYIRTANHSFLFLDYDFWHGEPKVNVAEPPPCISNVTVCQQDLDPVYAIRVGDINVLQAYEPNLMQFVYDFNPSPKSLRFILELEGNGTMTEEAACAWTLKNQNELQTWNLNANSVTSYNVKLFSCEDEDEKANIKLLKMILRYTKNQTMESNFEMKILMYLVNCSDPHVLSERIYQAGKYVFMNRLVGVIAVGVVGAVEAAAQASRMYLPLFLTDVETAAVASSAAEPLSTWRVLGRARHLALALQRFIQDSGWTRLAVLSQPTTLAAELYAEISDGATFAHREYMIPMRPSKQEVVNNLLLLQRKAPIVFVNADPEVAAVIMAAAMELEMTFAEGYVWILREWPVATVNTTVLTVSFWARGKQGVPDDEWHQPLLTELQALWKDGEWPPRAPAIIEAILTISAGLSNMLLHYPDTRTDLHSIPTMKAFYESINQKKIKGVNRYLHYKEGAVEQNYVFVDEWHDGNFSRLAAWRVNASERSMRAAVQGPYKRPEHLPRGDGASTCVVQAGDDFEPDCYDGVWASALLLLFLLPPALLIYRRALQRRISRLLKARESELLARRQHVAASLATYLMKREAVELREELGAGHFGCVRLALLRLPGHSSRYVAAKSLRENASPAEESEFLREACTIASLHHEHVVRLVGVCISDGPPLVLMELAFFGDLLGYLRARRHLADDEECADCAGQESSTSLEEATHVSSEALTRLAREAAAALAYLGSRGVVHRDVRAANCLVDARRSLKLADFGMARETVAGADGAPEYACRRRGMFPVLWMAPESLAHGVFSAATDVWALGVLVLELVTLGARPYGNMSPLRVLEYVAAGGRPPLPLDATPQTRGLARLCWQREAERRPSAAEVHAYLAARPRALRAALRIEERAADADSGLGESPSTELLPPGSPLDSIDELIA